MRDPDLVVRAQRAAAELERAWDRFRTAHGLGAEPLAAVSSYVGYSLEEPWGEPRVVFGVAAEEAEQLAALLNSHGCGGRPDAATPAAQARPGRPAAANGRLASLTAAAEIARAAAGARLQVFAHGPTAPRENAAATLPVASGPGTATSSTATLSSATATPSLRSATALRPVTPAPASVPPPAPAPVLPAAAAAPVPPPAPAPVLPAAAAGPVPPPAPAPVLPAAAAAPPAPASLPPATGETAL